MGGRAGEASLAKRVSGSVGLRQERWISPLAVRFSQGKIHPFFHERGPISEAIHLSVQWKQLEETQVMLQIKLKDGKRKRSPQIARSCKELG